MRSDVRIWLFQLISGQYQHVFIQLQWQPSGRGPVVHVYTGWQWRNFFISYPLTSAVRRQYRTVQQCYWPLTASSRLMYAIVRSASIMTLS